MTTHPLPDLELTGDPLDNMTLPEMRLLNDKLSRHLGRSVDAVHAITEPTADRWDALAYLAWVAAKRKRPTAVLGEFTRLSLSELKQVLSWTPPPPPEDQAADQADDADVLTLDDLAENAKGDPTAPTP